MSENANPAQTTASAFIVELALSKREFEVPADKSILSVLVAANIPVAFACEQGICGTCETVVIEGVPDHRDSYLTDAERASNDTMMICCSRAKSARLVLEI